MIHFLTAEVDSEPVCGVHHCPHVSTNAPSLMLMSIFVHFFVDGTGCSQIISEVNHTSEEALKGVWSNKKRHQKVLV